MKTPSEVSGLVCSRGKPITTIIAAWLPVNNMTHKLIMPLSLLPPSSSLLPLTRSHSITPMTATPPAWCPAHFPSAARTHPEPDRTWVTVGVGRCVKCFFFFLIGGVQQENSWEKWDTHQCSKLTSEPPPLYHFFPPFFWSRLPAPLPVPLVKSIWFPLCC